MAYQKSIESLVNATQHETEKKRKKSKAILNKYNYKYIYLNPTEMLLME